MPHHPTPIKIQGENRSDGDGEVVILSFQPQRYAIAYSQYLNSEDKFMSLYSISLWENKVCIKPKNPKVGVRNVPKKKKRAENGVTIWEGLEHDRAKLWKVTARLWETSDEVDSNGTALLQLKRDWKATELQFLEKPQKPAFQIPGKAQTSDKSHSSDGHGKHWTRCVEVERKVKKERTATVFTVASTM